jgi:Site-specific recombinase XerD
MYCQMKEVEEIIDELIEKEKKNSVFYKPRIKKFFVEFIDKDKPLDAITYYDVNRYLDGLDYSQSEKINRYSALNTFFNYTLTLNKTKELMSHVNKPKREPPQKKVLGHEDYLKLKVYIYSQDENLNNRLLLALFLFTGLSRQYILNLRHKDLLRDEGQYKLMILKNDQERVIPIKAELQLLIQEYLFLNEEEDKLKKITSIDKSVISTHIGKLTYEILHKKITPTVLSNTFIHYALIYGNNIWEISRLLLEDVKTIGSHVTEDNDLYNRQKSILNSF